MSRGTARGHARGIILSHICAKRGGVGALQLQPLCARGGVAAGGAAGVVVVQAGLRPDAERVRRAPARYEDEAMPTPREQASAGASADGAGAPAIDYDGICAEYWEQTPAGAQNEQEEEREAADQSGDSGLEQGSSEEEESSGVPVIPIDVTLVVVVVEGSFLEECLCRGSPHPACFNGERDKGDMSGRNILPPLNGLTPRILFLFLSSFRLAPRSGIRCETVVAR